MTIDGPFDPIEEVVDPRVDGRFISGASGGGAFHIAE